jgi:hypothetical protein
MVTFEHVAHTHTVRCLTDQVRVVLAQLMRLNHRSFSCTRGSETCEMANDLADFQAEAIARGYTHDFAFDAKSAPSDISNELSIVEYRTFDTGTDPDDDQGHEFESRER